MDMALADLTAAPEKPAFTDTIHMCSKCCRKLGEDGKALRKAVKAALRDAYGDAITVEKNDCFSLCPKGGQVVAAYSKKQPRRLVILEPDSNVKLAVEYLLRLPD
jgi:predicted metal-binding protein